MADDCVRCGRCLSVCPVYNTTRQELLSARGRLAAIDAQAEERLTDNRRFRLSLTACLLCGACERACTNQVPVRSHVLAARAGRASSLKRLGLTATVNPDRTAKAAHWTRQAEGLIDRLKHTGLAERFPGLKDLPPLAPQPLGQVVNRPQGEAEGRPMVVFPGCMTNLVYVEAGLAAVKSLAAAGWRVEVAAEAGCCGLPAAAAGAARLAQERVEAARDALKRAVDRAGEGAAIGFVCASCHHRLADELPKIWPDHPPLLDLAAAVDDRLPELKSRPQKVTYHDPCHSLDDPSAPARARDLLRTLPGVEFIESNAAPSCCGFGGLFSVSHPDISEAIGRRKGDDLAASGADIVATSCPACLLRLTALADKAGLKAVHLAQLVAERLPD